MIRRWLGVDFVDLLIQAGITMCAAIVAVEMFPVNEEVMVSTIFAASFGVLAYRRHWARKRGELGRRPGDTDPMAEARIEELEDRVAELESGQQRMLELEERLDFTERMLARREPQERIPGVGE